MTRAEAERWGAEMRSLAASDTGEPDAPMFWRAVLAALLRKDLTCRRPPPTRSPIG